MNSSRPLPHRLDTIPRDPPSPGALLHARPLASISSRSPYLEVERWWLEQQQDWPVTA